jgi:aryl-alcohol dehydrogenase-like predicted oxidoreductase
MKLGFGAWQLGGECTFGGKQTGWGKVDETEAIESIELALAAGIRFFDTAPGYGKGQSEALLGKVFSRLSSDEIQICTKYGSLENENGEAYLDFSPESLFRSIHESLKRLQIPKLDTVLLHSPPDDFDFQRLAQEPFEKLRTEGLISHYGVSVRSIKGAQNVIQSGFGDTLEAIFNVLDRRVEDTIFNQPSINKYRFIARVPLASGILSENFLLNPAVSFGETDIRSSIHPSDRMWFKESVQKLGFLNDLEGGISVSALRYVLHHPGVNFAIPGTRKVKHLESNLLALQLGPLPEEIQKKINEVLPETNPNWLPKNKA